MKIVSSWAINLKNNEGGGENNAHNYTPVIQRGRFKFFTVKSKFKFLAVKSKLKFLSVKSKFKFL